MKWLFPVLSSGAVGAAVYKAFDLLPEAGPLWLRLIWGVAAGGAVLLIARE